MFYVARIEEYEDGPRNAFLFQATNGVEASSIAADLCHQRGDYAVEVVLLDEYMSNGEILELCAF